MPGRKSTGKRLRFEIFKRDGFTCQYCGAQPPGVVLVVDHINPVAAGGATAIDNLITACEACNQGKAGNVLTQRAIRPDADLLYLETQQEIAELRRYQEALAAREEAIANLIEDLLDRCWFEVTELDWGPKDRIVRQILDRYGPEITEVALRETGKAVINRQVPGITGNGSAWVRYMWAVARNQAEREN